MDVPYYLCGQRDVNVIVCRRFRNWMYQLTSQLTLLNLQLLLHTLETTWLLRCSCCPSTGELVAQWCWKAAQWFCVHLHQDASLLFTTSEQFHEPPVSRCGSVVPLEAAVPAGVWTTAKLACTWHGTVRRSLRPKISSLYFLSFLSPTLLCLSHTSSYSQNTLQSRRDMTADEYEHPQPHKWKWLICHSSFQGGIFFPPPPTLNEGMISIWRETESPVAHNETARCLGKTFSLCDKVTRTFSLWELETSF